MSGQESRIGPDEAMNPAEFANIANCERDFWWYRGMRRILFRLMDPYLSGRHIRRGLEVGCGTGYMSRLFQKERGIPLVPMDLSEQGLRYAQRMGVEWPVQADAAALPFGGNRFDLVLSMDMMVHLPAGPDRAAAAEMARVLVPGGLLVLRTAALDLLRSHHSEFAFERQRFTRPRLVKLFEQAGFRILRCTYANSLLMPVALAKFRLWEPLRGGAASTGLEPVAPWLDRLLYMPLGIESACIAAGVNFPAGQSLLLVGEKME